MAGFEFAKHVRKSDCVKGIRQPVSKRQGFFPGGNLANSTESIFKRPAVGGNVLDGICGMSRSA